MRITSYYIMQKFTALHTVEVFKYLELDPDSHVQKALVLYAVLRRYSLALALKQRIHFPSLRRD